MGGATAKLAESSLTCRSIADAATTGLPPAAQAGALLERLLAFALVIGAIVAAGALVGDKHPPSEPELDIPDAGAIAPPPEEPEAPREEPEERAPDGGGSLLPPFFVEPLPSEEPAPTSPSPEPAPTEPVAPAPAPEPVASPEPAAPAPEPAPAEPAPTEPAPTEPAPGEPAPPTEPAPSEPAQPTPQESGGLLGIFGPG